MNDLPRVNVLGPPFLTKIQVQKHFDIHGYGGNVVAIDMSTKGSACVILKPPGIETEAVLKLTGTKLFGKYTISVQPFSQRDLVALTAQEKQHSKEIVVENLSPLITEAEIKVLVGVPIISIQFEPSDADVKNARVVLESYTDAARVINELNGKPLLGRKAVAYSAQYPVIQSVPAHSAMTTPPVSHEEWMYPVKVTQLPQTVSEQKLMYFFRQLNPYRCKIFDSKNRYAYVNFSTDGDAQNAVAYYSGETLEDCRVMVSLRPAFRSSVTVPARPLTTSAVRVASCASIEPSVIQKSVPVKRKTCASIRQANPKQPATDSRKTLIYVNPDTLPKSKSEFKRFLNIYLPRSDFEVVQIQRSEVSGAKVTLEFTSRNNAKRALKLISKKTDFRGSLSSSEATSEDITSSIADFKRSICTKRELYVSRHTKLDELTREQESLKMPKRPTLDQHQQITAQKNVLAGAIEECQLQRIEFNDYCDSLIKNLLHLESSLCVSQKLPVHRIVLLRKRFGRECVKFINALPIYAYRSHILETVRNSQVCILIGETGSGKSTQLVQYLYDAGFGENGVIVCTQPRKVAAITLAKHVSTEMGVAVGSELGYKAGLKHKLTKDTKVLYMTDHTLLNEGIKDPLFSKYTCLVIDEAHERSLHTDILLAFIKQCLPKRRELRVIITSATIDPTLFQKFFGNCPLIKVPGRTYPVEVEWNAAELPSDESPIQRDYVLDSVEVVLKIVQTQPPGDILTFLTSAADIERACTHASESLGDTVNVLPLHGRLQPEEQQKVFQIQDVRKIIFATNVAETSVTIPGVKYIVDSGLAKELKFDPKKSMNSLEVSMISKSSAEQRKGRAGRTSAGKCYRMYSEDLHSTMQDMMVPEILRVALSHTALKLYEFGIVDILSFEFVQCPNPAALKAAVNSLEFLGAVKDGKLTAVGKKMCALPIDPHFSKVLLDGIEQGVGLEAATAVAISTLGGNVFFRGGTDEMKMESDRKKISFCHPAGDQMTCLKAYHEWSSQKKDDRKKWCVKSYINSKSMHIIQDIIRDLCDILSNQLNCGVLPDRMKTLDQAEAKLPKLFFDAFIRNIAVFLGHERAGYLNEQLPDERLFVFPGSSLCQLNPIPTVVVYEKTLKTSRHFLLQVVPVRDEWIEEAISDGRLSCHPIESPLYDHYKVSPISRSNLGVDTLKLLFRARNDFEQHLQLLYPGISIVFEFLRSKGVLQLYLHDYHNDALQIVEDHVCQVREDYKKKQFECGATKDTDSVRVVLGCGGSVQHVLMPHDYRDLRISGPLDHDGMWQSVIAQELEKYGELQQKSLKHFQNQSCLFVTFSCPDAALEAVRSAKTPEGVVIEPQLFRRQGGEAVSQFTLTVEWTRRERTNCAFVSFHCQEDFVIANRCVGHSMNEMKFRASKDGSTQLFVSNVGAHVTAETIQNAIISIIPELSAELFDVKLGFVKSFATSEDVLLQMKDTLEALVVETATRGQYTLHMPMPKPQYTVYRAYVNFQDPNEGHATLTALQKEHIQGKSLAVTPKLSSSFRCSPAIYAVIKTPLDVIKQQLQDSYKSIKITDTKRDKREYVIFEIHANNVSAFIAAKHALNGLLHPEVVQNLDPRFHEYMQTLACEVELKRIESATSTYVYRDLRDMSIKMYRAEAAVTRAKVELNKCLDFLKENVKCFDIQLKGPGIPPGLMKHFVSLFGHDLKGLVDDAKGITAARINPRKHMLTLFASEEGHQSVVQIISTFVANADPQMLANVLQESVVECCICLTEIEDLKCTFRPEYCGHPYCLDCVQIQVAPSTVKFPILCEAEGCSQPFVWKDFETLFQRTSFNHRELANASLKCYVGANQKVVRNCPTPDCSSIYRVSGDGKCFLCSECNASTCTKCHEPYHDGVTCEMYQGGKKADKEFEEWMKCDPATRKRCPQCTAPIEKTEGCSHVYCMKCHAHVCWVCRKHFNSSQTCYAHLGSEHGGFA